MCIIAAGPGLSAAAAAAANATIAVTAISTAASVGMGIMSAQQQAANAQVNLNAQAQAQQVQLDAQRKQSVLNQQNQRQALLLQQQQGIDSYNLQVEQTNNALQNNWNQQREQVELARQQKYERFQEESRIYHKDSLAAGKQIDLNNQAANSAYMQEQTKLNEAKKKAAFENQTLLAKSIGAKGTILASGRTGQSIGVILGDVDRQIGFEKAMNQATLDSKRDASIIAMEGNWLKAQSENNKAKSSIGLIPEIGYLPDIPDSPIYVTG